MRLLGFGDGLGPLAGLSLVALGFLPVGIIVFALIAFGAYFALQNSRSELEVTSTALRIDGTTYPFASTAGLQEVQGGLDVTLDTGRSWTLHASQDVCRVVTDALAHFRETRADSEDARAQRRALAQLNPQ